MVDGRGVALISNHYANLHWQFYPHSRAELSPINSLLINSCPLLTLLRYLTKSSLDLVNGIIHSSYVGFKFNCFPMDWIF